LTWDKLFHIDETVPIEMMLDLLLKIYIIRNCPSAHTNTVNELDWTNNGAQSEVKTEMNNMRIDDVALRNVSQISTRHQNGNRERLD